MQTRNIHHWQQLDQANTVTTATREYQNKTIDDKSGFIMYSIMGQNTKVTFWH